MPEETETPEERAFRHERERFIGSILMWAVVICIGTVAIAVLFFGVPFMVAVGGAISALSIIMPILLILNMMFMNHEEKDGGD